MVLEAGVTGQQMPTFFHLPTARVPKLGSLGSEIADLADLAGIPLDPWQKWIMEQACMMREETFWNPYTSRDEHLWAAFEIMIEVSRQNGKSLLAEARQLAGLFLFGERLIIHSAHKFDTSKETFEHVLQLIQECPDLDRKLVRVVHGHGEEGIEVRARKGAPTQRLTFRTRGGTSGGGRGFSSDCLFLDEAMFLTGAQTASLIPTLSARPNPQVWLLGSAGNKDSVGFGRTRRRVLRRDEEFLFGALWEAELCTEFCPRGCTKHDDPADPNTWLKVNPGTGIRLRIDRIRAEYKAMQADFDPREFAMERLGVGDWPVEEGGWLIIGEDEWMRRKQMDSAIAGPFALAVSVSHDCKHTAIAAVGANAAGLVHGEITAKKLAPGDWDYRPGTRWAVPRIKDICTAHHPEFVVIDKATQAGMFVAELEASGITVVSPTSREYAQACGEFRSSVVPVPGEQPWFTHIDQEPLNRALGAADKRNLTGLWAWAPAGIDISPIEAITLGFWGHKQYLYTQQAVAPWVAWA